MNAKTDKDELAPEEFKLVEFFRNEGSQLGQEGDDAQRTPAEQAIYSMRELLRHRSMLAEARSNNRMRLAVPRTCESGHRYYIEFHSSSKCPYCLERDVQTLQTMRNRAKESLAYALAALK